MRDCSFKRDYQTGSRSRVNGCLVNQEFMRHFRELFIDVHSQHQTYSFLQPKYHIILLDAYAKNTCGVMLENYRKEFYAYKEMQSKLEDLKILLIKQKNRLIFLSFRLMKLMKRRLNLQMKMRSLTTNLQCLKMLKSSKI